MYRYIGNKTKLLPYIMERTEELIGNQGTVADIMAGTGSVSLEYRKRGYRVVASDMMTYSYHHLNVNLLIDRASDFNGLIVANEVPLDTDGAYASVLRYLNNLKPRESFFYKEFSPAGNPSSGCEPRKYFSSYNAGKIDAIREKINEWKNKQCITPLEESLLKHTLIMAVNEIANISGTYNMELKPVELYSENATGHQVLLGFAEEIANRITANLCYIDPPYMKRQYAANYHILETIARGDFPEAIGKSGLRDWWDQHSKLCTKTRGIQSFRSNNSKLPKNLKEYLISIERR